MNTTEVYGLYAGVLVLGAGFLGALWHGVIVVTFSFGVKVVPPWSRHAPAPKKKPAATPAVPDSAEGAADDAAPAPSAVPDRRAA